MWLIVSLVASLFIYNHINACPPHQLHCTTPNGTKGFCTQSKNCPKIHNLIESTPSEFITKSICGIDLDNSRLFCCDQNDFHVQLSAAKLTPSPSRFLSAASVAQKKTLVRTENLVQRDESASVADSIKLPQPNNCQTPNGGSGLCVSIFNCSRLLSIPQRNKDVRKIKFLRESICGNQNTTVFVCCGSDDNFRSDTEDSENLGRNFDDLSRECGIETEIVDTSGKFGQIGNESEYQETGIGSSNLNITLKNRIFGGDDTEIIDFPWLALLEYHSENNEEKLFLCGGSLISSRYVLTAAHCIPSGRTELVGVRLGEWNYANQEENCGPTSKGMRCFDRAINVGIESIHPHPGHTREQKYHDIALIRLNEDVKITNHIKPICLPNTDDYLISVERLTISGWGLQHFDKRSSIKQKLNIPIVGLSKCSVMFDKFRDVSRTYQLGRGQFCAGGERGKDSCTGDSGIPLMKRFDATSPGSRPRWRVEGIVSFGLGCGQRDYYGVYTKVSNYLGWIHRTIVP
uniref:CLIP domain-containing serine protease n=1 Tax=Dendroctonus ponderosae TaxID=77166 RepID=A0AAR5PH77_DENPD